MATVVVNRLEVEPAPPPAAEPQEAASPETPAREEIQPREVERALRAIEVRRARVRAH